MTKKETIQIMALLGGFYGKGKSNPEIMAEAWYLILADYDYEIASRAVLRYAKNDVREYASFPTVGNIVRAIEQELSEDKAPLREVVRAVSYGWGYDQLSDRAQALIDEKTYDSWIDMDAEEFAQKSQVLMESLKQKQKLLKG